MCPWVSSLLPPQLQIIVVLACFLGWSFCSINCTGSDRSSNGPKKMNSAIQIQIAQRQLVSQLFFFFLDQSWRALKDSRFNIIVFQMSPNSKTHTEIWETLKPEEYQGWGGRLIQPILAVDTDAEIGSGPRFRSPIPPRFGAGYYPDKRDYILVTLG